MIPAGTFVRFCLSWTVVIVVLELAAMERWVEIPTHDPDQSSARVRHFRLFISPHPPVLPPSRRKPGPVVCVSDKRRAKIPRGTAEEAVKYRVSTHTSGRGVSSNLLLKKVGDLLVHRTPPTSGLQLNWLKLPAEGPTPGEPS